MLTTSLTTPSKLIESKLPCPSCTSSDAYHLYDDGHGYCFSCNTRTPSRKEGDFVLNENELDTNTYTYEFIPLRGISKSTLKKYNAITKISPEGKPLVIGFPFPNGSLKLRSFTAKDIQWKKGDGYADPQPGLFGRDKFEAGEHKFVVITEGEFDALSIYQTVQIPAVSVQSASTAVRDVSADRAFINSFERIYLAFDGDRAGREAADKVAQLFDFNKVYQLKFDKFKDANDFLQHGDDASLRNVFHNARRYQPDNIISHLNEFDAILAETKNVGIPYPFSALNEKTYGIRTSESVLITAQEGVGKTELMHAIEYQILKETDDAVGAIFLEEPKQRHLQALAGLELGKPAHLPDSGCTLDQVRSALRTVVGTDERLHVYSHFGSDDPDALIDTIRFLVTARSCRYILLDHISMVVSGLAGEDERRALDYFSTRLEMLVKELDFALIMVSHVNDYGQTRGSRYISKVADIRIDISRDVMNADPVVRNTTELVVSKNRFSGKTGFACKLLFDRETHRYAQIEDNLWLPPTPGNDNTPFWDQGGTTEVA